MPSVAGGLTTAAGAMEIAGAWPLGWLVRGVVGFGTSGATEIPIVLVALPLSAIGVVALIGGTSALRHHNWKRAMAGAICATIILPLGVPAIILLGLSKTEFHQ